jgi:hypothetical protein
MFSPSNLLTFVLAAVSLNSALATPVTVDTPAFNKLTISSKYKLSTLKSNGVTIADVDRARAQSLVNVGDRKENEKRQSSFPVTNGVVTYTADVGVGSPATTYSLIIDTGSSNTFIGAGKTYVKTSTSKSTGNSVSVSYGSGSFSGTEYTDTVTLSSGLVIKNQSIAVASTSTGFDGVDGILGVGPVDLTDGTVKNTGEVPTVTDNLYSQGTIPANSLGVFFAPTTSTSTKNGELTFGGADTSKISGSLSYVPVTSTYPASYYWGVDQSIGYGTTTLLSTTAGIVDTGTTLTLIASDAFKKYKTATGAVADSATGLLRITSAQYSNLKNLDFKIGGKTYSLTPNAQIFPRSLNTQIGGSANSIYLIVADIGSSSGQGLDFINGYSFLERFYTVYDTQNSRLGFAATQYTTATTN